MKGTLLSIVIANYNYGRFLEEAIKSVISQDMGVNIELIICDAGSTDNSLEVIMKYANGLPQKTSFYEWQPTGVKPHTNITWWCSEKDGGQSDAFNKGFSHAQGEWISWLNADDLLLPGAISAFARLVERHPKAEWVTGNRLSFNSQTGLIVQVNWGPHSQPPFLKRQRAFSAVFGPTTFWRKELYVKMGPIDEKLHFAMDTEYWARLTMAGVPQYRLNYICWAFRLHDESKTEGVQSTQTLDRRTLETKYWQDKTGYKFIKSWRNIWYIAWCIWRIIDGSWVVRVYKKFRLEGKNISCIMR